MAKKNQHVVPKDGEWAVRRDGASRASKVFNTQSEAIKFARNQAMKHSGELYIHNADGSILDRRSYGNDPGHRTGKK